MQAWELEREWGKAQDKLKAIENTLIDVCEDYGTEYCKEGICDCDPNGWEGCLTRKILEIIDQSSGDTPTEGEK